MVLAVMCVGYFLVLLDVTALNVAVPAIGASLGVGVTGLQWVVNGYALALAALLLVGGALGDAYGHRRVVLAGLALFGAASAGCGLAPAVGVLVAARVLQGVGAALLLPGTLAIITRAFPEPAAQARAIGVWAGVGSVALPAGPLLGGGLVATWGWRSVFLVNVPVVLVAALVALRTVRGDRVEDARPDLGRLGRAVLGLLRRPAFAVANAVAAAMNFGSLGLLFLLTLFLQAVQHRSAPAAGAAVLPLFLPLVVLAPLAGRATARWGPRPTMLAGLGAAAVGVGLLAGWEATTPYDGLLPAMLAWGIGLGVLTPAVVAAALAAVPPRYAGLASGVNNTARQAGGVAGIALYASVAGAPDDPARFLAGLHVTGLVTAGLFVTAAVATALAVPLRPPATVGRDVEAEERPWIGSLSSPEAAGGSAARSRPASPPTGTTS
jgi:DHA2 family methylenomycin A resistance protein-like MFS transporter